ncbi:MULTISPECIES: zinc dependent phospholipase C family protein [Clostridium]|nr:MULTISPECIES: zinc dependent phospholipase C family protein [Clostridium]MDU1935482.1 zinc dependent phospholipase C family protein [Clostridium sp.]MDU2043951.1 zinc dependent phospholipase C family protein [Clostridium sp.]MDU7213274.1 zinc dependent phospholipase C family protein [Clostridium sp.]CUQ04822.1 zinc dependent phospholipase C [Clostridium paraputrificum]
MKLKTHLFIAKKIINNNKDNVLLKYYSPFFYLGTILPDLIASYKVHPHYFEESSEYVYSKIEKISNSGKLNIFNSIRAGIVVHYLCDFCCHAHIRGNFDSLRKHLKYENDLEKFILEEENSEVAMDNNINTQSSNILYGPKTLNYYIIEQIKSYRLGAPSYMWDYKNATELCSTVFNSLFNLCTSYSIIYRKLAFSN